MSKNSVEPVLCKSGEYLNSESRCELIPTGYYNPDLESFNVYYKCPEGTTSLTGSTSCQVKSTSLTIASNLHDHPADKFTIRLNEPGTKNCPAGEYNSLGSNRNYACIPVLSGKMFILIHTINILIE